MEKFPTLGFIVRFGTSFSAVLALFAAGMTAILAYPLIGMLAVGAGVVVGLILFVLFKSYVELVFLITDMLAPK